MAHYPLKGLRILAVENDALNAEAMKCLLEVQGAVVLGPVAQVSAALDVIERDAPDLALLDFRLNGETIEVVIDALKLRAIPFVLVTACAPCLMPPDYAGMTTVLKPFMLDSLIAAVTQVRAAPTTQAMSARPKIQTPSQRLSTESV